MKRSLHNSPSAALTTNSAPSARDPHNPTPSHATTNHLDTTRQHPTTNHQDTRRQHLATDHPDATQQRLTTDHATRHQLTSDHPDTKRGHPTTDHHHTAVTHPPTSNPNTAQYRRTAHHLDPTRSDPTTRSTTPTPNHPVTDNLAPTQKGPTATTQMSPATDTPTTTQKDSTPADPDTPALIPLRRQRDYRLLWTARTVSVTGSEVSKLAIPLTAVTLLTASPAQMGILTAAGSIPALLFGLQSGAIADRLIRHRPLMIACELISCAAAATVPIAWLLGTLNVFWLIVVALVIGTAGVVFKAANFPHIAAVVPSAQRTEAIAGFHASYSVASVSGPGLAGLLVQLLTAPLAVLAEAVSFLTSALLLRSIRTPEQNTATTSRGMWRDIGEGLRASITHPVLRALLGAGVTINFFAMAYTAVYMLYMLNTLNIPQSVIGPLIALGGVGGIFGAWATVRLSKRYGENRVLLTAVLFFPSEILAVGLLTGPLWWKLSVLALTSTVTGAIVVAFATCIGTIILRETSPELRGRVNATTTFAVQGVLALGGLAGGLAAELLGLRPVILICAAGIALSTIWIWTSPLRPHRRPNPLPRGAQPPFPRAEPATPSLTESANNLIELRRFSWL